MCPGAGVEALLVDQKVAPWVAEELPVVAMPVEMVAAVGGGEAATEARAVGLQAAEMRVPGRRE